MIQVDFTPNLRRHLTLDRCLVEATTVAEVLEHGSTECVGGWWMQHHNGIWRSSDDCATWQEITEVQPSNFGFALAVHPLDGNTAWFVPSCGSESRYPVAAKMVVNRTGDGGDSFFQLKNGLPQDDAYDLVYRHGLEIIPLETC